MHPLTRVRDHQLQALSIPAIGAALLVLPGCLALYEYEPVTVTVIDAESNAPIRRAQVELSYPHVMCLNPPRDIACETGSDGRVEIEVATFDVKWWRVSSPGYITDDSGHITDRPGDGRVGSPGNPHEFRLYREPEPEIVVVIPTGYVGPVLIDFIPSKTWIQDAPGSRRFSFESSANGYVPIIASPLIYRARWRIPRVEYRDGRRIAHEGDVNDHELAFRTVEFFGKDLEYWLCLVGTSADEQALLDRVAPRTNGTRHWKWDQATNERLLLELKQAGIVPAAR